MIVIVMGVSGSGKTTIGKLLSKTLHIPFYDADDFHPQENISKMSSGIPLNDSDRLPWLKELSNQIKLWNTKDGGVLACSALKTSYRDILNANDIPITWVYLEGSFELIKSRLEKREHHYMDGSLLKSQFDDLEKPKQAITISIDQKPEEIVKTIVQRLRT